MAQTKRGPKARARRVNKQIDESFSSPEAGQMARKQVAAQLKQAYGGAQRDINREIKTTRREAKADSQFAADTFGGVQQRAGQTAEAMGDLAGGQSQAYRELAATMGTALGMSGAEAGQAIRRTARGNLAKLRTDRRDLKSKRRGDRWDLIGKARDREVENEALAQQYGLDVRKLDITEDANRKNFRLGRQRLRAQERMNDADNETSTANNAADNATSEANNRRTNRGKGKDGKPVSTDTKRAGRDITANVARYEQFLKNNPEFASDYNGAYSHITKKWDADPVTLAAAMDLHHYGVIGRENRRKLAAQGVDWKWLEKRLGRRSGGGASAHPNT